MNYEKCRWAPPYENEKCVDEILRNANKAWKGDGKMPKDGIAMPDSEAILNTLYDNNYSPDKTESEIHRHCDVEKSVYFTDVPKWNITDIENASFLRKKFILFFINLFFGQI